MGPALAALRKRAGLTQPELSERTEVSVQLLSRYEGGAHMRLDTLEKILDALGADLHDLGVEARKAVGGTTPAGNGDAVEGDPRIALIDRYAREIGLDALAEVAKREREHLVEAAVRRLDPK
jgi:transcriptional regulator with XRE-family HTH domain